MLFGLFLILHGLVFIFYAGQSFRMFKLQPGMKWPDESWAFTKMIGNRKVRSSAGVCCLLPSLGFMAGGLGIILNLEWYHPVIISTSVFSIITILIFWDGKFN